MYRPWHQELARHSWVQSDRWLLLLISILAPALGLISLVDAARQDYDYLFTIGTTLFALLRNISDNNPRSLLHLESETGAVLSHYVAYSAQKQGCIYPLLNSPSSLYALCDVYPNTWQVRSRASPCLPAWQVMRAPYPFSQWTCQVEAHTRSCARANGHLVGHTDHSACPDQGGCSTRHIGALIECDVTKDLPVSDFSISAVESSAPINGPIPLLRRRIICCVRLADQVFPEVQAFRGHHALGQVSH